MAEDRWNVAAPGVTVALCAETPLQILRLRQPGAHEVDRVGEALGTALPVQPNGVTGDPARAVWIGPGEWLLIGPAPDRRALATACADVTHHLSDIGDGRAAWSIDGTLAAALLAKGCTLDLHPRALPPGTAAQTAFAQSAVLLLAEPSGAFRLYADVSLAAYLQQWFADAIVEFRSSEARP